LDANAVSHLEQMIARKDDPLFLSMNRAFPPCATRPVSMIETRQQELRTRMIVGSSTGNGLSEGGKQINLMKQSSSACRTRNRDSCLGGSVSGEPFSIVRTAGLSDCFRTRHVLRKRQLRARSRTSASPPQVNCRSPAGAEIQFAVGPSNAAQRRLPYAGAVAQLDQEIEGDREIARARLG
jgi:hypothetical protein